MPQTVDDRTKSDEEFYDESKRRQAEALKEIEANYDKSADSSQEDDNIERARSLESNPGGIGERLGAGYRNNFTGKSPAPSSRMQRFVAFAKKRGAVFGLVGALGIGGAFAASIFGPAGMVIGVAEGFTQTNDSSSTAMERRFMKAFGFATSGDQICANSSRSIKCKMGRISYSALRKLAAHGAVAYNDSGPMDLDKKGYPQRNPTGYTIDFGDGRGPQKVAADRLISTMAQNPKVAAKILGAGGAFNLRVKAWAGKHIFNKLYKKFGISKKGGLADGSNTSSRYQDVLDKLRKKIPGLEKLGNIRASVGEKISGKLNGAKKGGTGYILAVASCIGIKAPAFIAAGVAAVQLAQLMPVSMETILSPGSKLKGSGVDPASNFSVDDINAVGTLLTERTPRESDGKLTSALDSQYLQAAMGVNTGKPPVSEAFAPGFSVLTSQVVLGSVEVDRNLAPACNGILSPSAMYTSMAVDAGITVAASATIIGGVIKVAAGWALAELVVQATEMFIKDQAVNIATALASNNLVGEAKGEALGDVIGLSAMGFFSAGGMARNLPVLKTGEQLQEFAAIQQENEAFRREMDIASLSPFDTSSPYTFMGSLVHNLQKAAVASGSSNDNLLSMVSNLARVPSLSTQASAASPSFTDHSCGYAAEFGLVTEDPENTPAINAAGLPCTGLTRAQESMSTNSALDLILAQGWLDETKTIKDNATIEDLLKSGYIRDETPLSDFINTCSDASTGDYLYNSASCTVNTDLKNPGSIGGGIESSDVGSAADGPSDGAALTAMSVFLLDFQIMQSVNGEDEVTATTAASTDIDQAHIYEDSTGIDCAPGTDDAGTDTGYDNGTPVGIRLCSIPGTTDDSHGGEPLKVNSRVSGAVLEMTRALAAALGVETLRVADSYRTMAEQEEAYAQYGAGRAAAPGMSNHQMGIAIDFQLGSNEGATREGDPTYDWLVANAKNYGFGKLQGESWHWQPLGARYTEAMS